MKFAGERRLQITYNNLDSEALPVEEIPYQIRYSGIT